MASPLGQRVFRWLWLGMLFSWIGTWMQTVGAQWLLVDEPNAAALVSLVQAANTLPMMLLALPGGVLADSFDRRWLLITVQAYLFVLGILLAVLTAAGHDAAGAAAGLHLRPRRRRSGAAPGLAGHDARAGAQDTAACGDQAGSGQRQRGPFGRAGAGRAGDRLPRRRPGRLRPQRGMRLSCSRSRCSSGAGRQVGSEIRRERFVPALRAGGRYVWHEPVVRRILLRVILFVAPAMALWALLPLIASQRLGLGADGYGALFGALGVGAIVGALRAGTSERPPVHQRAADGAAGVALRGGYGADRAGPQLSGGPGDPGARRAGLDGGDLDAGRRAAAVPAGLGPRPWPRRSTRSPSPVR